ncbi:MAG: PAS domain S-box protein [Salibacteraceae bacterium]
MEEIEILKRAIKRERLARKQAESIMEAKSLELYESNQKLIALNQNLEAEIVKGTAEIAQKEVEFKGLVESATEIIFKIDTKGIFTYVNPVTSSISGYSESELIGKSFTNFVRKDYVESLAQVYYNQLDDKTEKSVTEFPMITKNGEEIWLNQSATLVFDKDVPLEFVVLSHDVTKVKRTQDAMALSEEKYRGIIENLELGILEVDNDDKILKAYTQFCKLTGYSEEELIGKSSTDLLVGEEGREVFKKQLEERKKGNSGVYEIPIVKKNGSIAWVIISGAPFYNLKGEQMGTMGIHLDISHRKSIESQLRESKLKAEELYKVKELFMANMSHEIRTPMNAIIGMAELLGQSNLSEKQDKYVSAIQSSSKNLLVLINDLLDFSKIESGKLILETIPFHLKDLILKTKDLLASKADENGVQIIYEIDKELPTHFLGDPTRLGQVLINLVGNAVKFTTNGNVYLSVKSKITNGSNQQLFFEIRDEGIGISENEMRNIFSNYSQANESTARLYGGTGLGLSISQKLVDLMGGQLGVSSVKGKGSSFFFSLEMAASPEYVSRTESNFIFQVDFHKAQVLLVEDNPVNVLIAKTNLENWNCQVEVAENGLEAVSLLKKKEFNLVLMDMRMPVMGGVEATQVIRNKMGLSVPIIALTGNAIKGDQEKCISAGMNDYLSKPFEQKDLNQILSKWVVKKDVQRDMLVDLKGLQAMGDDDFVKRMVDLFIEESGKDIVNIKSAISSRDQEKIKNIAHKLKPSVRYVCVESMYAEVKEIENGKDSDEAFFNKTKRFVNHLEQVIKQLQ